MLQPSNHTINCLHIPAFNHVMPKVKPAEAVSNSLKMLSFLLSVTVSDSNRSASLRAMSSTHLA